MPGFRRVEGAVQCESAGCAGLWSPIKQNDSADLFDTSWSLESGT